MRKCTWGHINKIRWSPIIDLFWKRMSFFLLRLLWKMSLQMLCRLFPLTDSYRGKKKLYLVSRFNIPFYPHGGVTVTQLQTCWHPHTRRRLTERQSLAMCRLSWSELRSTRWNSVWSIPDLLLPHWLNMPAFSKILCRLSHKLHRWSTEPIELPGIAQKCLVREKNYMKFRAKCQTFTE